jgi:TonB family protein
MTEVLPLQVPKGMPAANDRLKGSFNDWFWGSLALAALLHYLVLAHWPEMRAADVSIRSGAIEQIEVAPEIVIPPPPEAIQRPMVPLLSTEVRIDEDLTIPPTTFHDNPPADLPPPPRGGGVDVSDQPTFTPYEVKPELRNRAEYGRALERRYPPMLKDAGIGGTAVLWVFIDEQGAVTNTRVVDSSGYDQLDDVAQAVMRETARFTPALNRDQRVPVWIQIPVTFRTR